ncbi:hypothetical protein HG535_0C00130 [Zygotorulaspora mrakii]|uniref:Major facilitator superfamily (MFS) profile domain-containing protein n=1 Tax=Zygotorulaspora mrakii TaxID=42260 RepID=A0A7H9AZP3_ZYGMR|nr:uncharacterized protein HG535_0C00130 [Zygotorulaspora mrakii]QLG71667.1 hypothetical protein HG535_0C00130 [Zygotorulaspora mrakii]
MKDQVKVDCAPSPVESCDSNGSLSLEKNHGGAPLHNDESEDEPIQTILSARGKPVKVWADFDDAMDLADKASDLELTPEEDKKLCRKIDLHMFPLMSLLYAIQYMDKTSNGNAAIMGLITDLKMVGDQYSWASSAFYFGYLGGLFVLPPLLQKSKYFMKTLAAIIILWGMVLTVHAAPNVNFASFVFLRCLLGFLESAITPAFTVITAQYWRKEEHFLRICIWFGFNGFGAIWGCSIAYGLFIRADVYSIPAWKIVFIVNGCITVFVGFLMLFILPDAPQKAWFLSKREKLLLILRIKGNQQGFGNHHIKKHQIWEAFRDLRTWIYFFYAISASIPNGGITNFQTILLHGDFEYTTKQTLVISIAISFVSWLGVPLFGYASSYYLKKKSKYLGSCLIWSIISLVIVLLGVCLLAFLESSKQGRLAGLVFILLSPVALISVLANISANTLGYTKKWTVMSIMLIGYCAGNIAGPHTFIESQAPHYQGAKVTLVVCFAVGIALLTGLYILNVSENKKRDRYAMENTMEENAIQNIEFADLTDFENPLFRYTL